MRWVQLISLVHCGIVHTPAWFIIRNCKESYISERYMDIIKRLYLTTPLQWIIWTNFSFRHINGDKEALFLSRFWCKDTTQSTSTSSGALVVQRWLGVRWESKCWWGKHSRTSWVWISCNHHQTVLKLLIRHRSSYRQWRTGHLNPLKWGITVLTICDEYKRYHGIYERIVRCLESKWRCIGIGRNLKCSGITILSGVTMIILTTWSLLSS